MAAPTTTDERRGLGVLATTTAVVLWGATTVLVKEVDLEGVAVSFHRLWIGALLIVAIFTARGGRITLDLLRRSLLGGVCFLLDIVLFFSAVQETSVANATVIGALQPILVVLVSFRLFGEHARLVDLAWGLVAIAGTVVVVLGGDAGGATSRFGDLLAVGALFAWTGYFITSKQARQGLTSFEYVTGLSIVAAIGIIPLPWLFGQSLAVSSAGDWMILVVLAVVNGAIGHFLINWSHAHVPLVIVSLLTLAIPVVSAATAAIFIDEPLTVLQVGGLAVVVGALAVVVVGTARGAPVVAAAEIEAIEDLPTP